MMNNEDYISIVLGQPGVGKSSFINLITKSLNCKTSDRPELCTQKYNITRTIYNKSEYYFIDTPGISDIRYEKEYLKEIKKAITEYPKIRCLIILFNYQNKRITQSDTEFLKILMEYFPTEKFWDHVIIVRTHAFIFEDEDEERDRLNFNSIKDIINAPKEIEEYYLI